MYVLGALILRYTQFGRAVFAVGSNREAARLSGISVTATTVAVFAICGLTAGMGAVIQTGRLTGVARDRKWRSSWRVKSAFGTARRFTSPR